MRQHVSMTLRALKHGHGLVTQAPTRVWHARVADVRDVQITLEAAHRFTFVAFFAARVCATTTTSIAASASS